MPARTKRIFKDSLFRWLFKHKKLLLPLYNALANDNLTDMQRIKLTTLDNVLFNGPRNDLSFTVGPQQIILLEHQSTLNENMPLRMLIYLVTCYEKQLKRKDIIYKKKRIPLPSPRFFVLYNGSDSLPPVSRLHLSDAFELPTDCIDLTVTIYNINYQENSQLLQKVQPLREYSYFIESVRYNHQTLKLDRDDAIEAAISECQDLDIIKFYFEKHPEEVFKMARYIWDEKEAMEYAKNEAREEGREEERLNSIKRSIQTARDFTNDKTAVIKSIIKQYALTEAQARAAVEANW